MEMTPKFIFFFWGGPYEGGHENCERFFHFCVSAMASMTNCNANLDRPDSEDVFLDRPASEVTEID